MGGDIVPGQGVHVGMDAIATTSSQLVRDRGHVDFMEVDSDEWKSVDHCCTHMTESDIRDVRRHDSTGERRVRTETFADRLGQESTSTHRDQATRDGVQMPIGDAIATQIRREDQSVVGRCGLVQCCLPTVHPASVRSFRGGVLRVIHRLNVSGCVQSDRLAPGTQNRPRTVPSPKRQRATVRSLGDFGRRPGQTIGGSGV